MFSGSQPDLSEDNQRGSWIPSQGAAGSGRRNSSSALSRRSKAIYPALVLALNCGLRDKEIRTLQWGRLHLDDAYLVVGETKTGGSGRTIPLNSLALAAIQDHEQWYTEKFAGRKPE
jgi:integrase